MPQVHVLLISNTTVRVNSIARTLEHARRSQLPLLEVLKLQELAYSGKNRNKMLELATQNYESNTDKAPSQHHLQVIKRTFQELSSRTMGQSIRRIFPSFMSGNYADDDSVVMRDEFGPFSRTLRTIHQDAIRQAIENPDRGGISWIGHRAFDKMRTAL